jgi:hypothetical protein
VSEFSSSNLQTFVNAIYENAPPNLLRQRSGFLPTGSGNEQIVVGVCRDLWDAHCPTHRRDVHPG